MSIAEISPNFVKTRVNTREVICEARPRADSGEKSTKSVCMNSGNV